ncbi:MAG TPA: acyl-CoA dehydrogenase family protein, partial [Polyangiaceae bacterium]|nr:acyl-CoA dehydrogenase family protein [Polyangiaceae bacterium]
MTGSRIDTFHRVRDEFVDKARRVAEIAAASAKDVDANARFPVEAVDALRAERLLGIAVPTDYGGAGSGLAELAEICSVLAQSCATTGMVYAMHQIQVLCMLRHVGDSAFFPAYLA